MAGQAMGIMGIEKQWFPWKSESIQSGRPAIFTGCNAVLFMPETVQMVLGILGKHQYGWIYDCCGKPLDRTEAGTVGIQRLENRIQKHKISEIAVFCPNCYYYLKGKLSVPVVPLYDSLKREGILPQKSLSEATLFIPCPDRAEKTMLGSMERWLGQTFASTYAGSCCGLAQSDSEGPRSSIQRIKNLNQKMRPYCASCFGQFRNHGISHSPHVLSEVFGIEEGPITVPSRILNRIRPLRWKKQGV